MRIVLWITLLLSLAACNLEAPAEPTPQPLATEESPSAEITPGCTPRADWTTTYELSSGETLAQIADLLEITVQDIVDGNCLEDPDVIFAGQQIQLPEPPYIGDGPGLGPPPGDG